MRWNSRKGTSRKNRYAIRYYTERNRPKTVPVWLGSLMLGIEGVLCLLHFFFWKQIMQDPRTCMLNTLQFIGMTGIALLCMWLVHDWKQWRELSPQDKEEIKQLYRDSRRRPGDPF